MDGSPDNVILITLDALRADHLGCYGYDRYTSPEIDQLANEAIRFRNAYSASSHTREAVPALLTGEYPNVAVDKNYNLATSTIALSLSSEGFKTAGFHSNPYVSRAYGFDRGFNEFDDDLHLGQHKFIVLAQRALDRVRNRRYARAEEINERSLKWIDSLDDDKSFFLWNHYMDTHGPYEPPEEYSTRYRNDPISDRDAQSLYQRAIKKPESITYAERKLLINSYDNEIRYNDAKIGEFLGALRERDLIENSLLIMTSDHGDAFGEHGYYGHPRYLHEEVTHVPLLVHSPRMQSKQIETYVSTLDIVQTIESAVDRESVFSLLEPSDADRRIFSQARGENECSHIRRYAARSAEGISLCERDMETGAIEFTEVTDQGLRSELESHIEEVIAMKEETADLKSEPNDVDEEIEQRLEALGYE